MSRLRKALLVGLSVVVAMVVVVVAAEQITQRRVDARLDAAAGRLEIPEGWSQVGEPGRQGNSLFFSSLNPRRARYTYRSAEEPTANQIRQVLQPISDSPELYCPGDNPLAKTPQTDRVEICSALASDDDAFVSLVASLADGGYLIDIAVSE